MNDWNIFGMSIRYMKNWTDNQQCEIVVIGGGPAGMLAAATAAQAGA